MNTDVAPGVVRRLFAFGLKRLRLDAGFSQAQAAKEMRCSQGRVANLEAQRNLPRLEFLEKLLRLYGADAQIPRYTELLDLAEKRSWWEGLSETHDIAGFDVFLGLEEGASKIEIFQPLLVPGLLQTEPYARAVMGQSQRDRAGLDRAITLRVKRQEALTREPPLHLWCVLDESALDRMAGTAEVQRDQLDHLVTISEQAPHVQIQVIPRYAGIYPGLSGPFTILNFPLGEDPGVVYVETHVKAVWFEEPSEIDQHNQKMDHLRAAALSPEQSRALIEQKRREM